MASEKQQNTIQVQQAMDWCQRWKENGSRFLNENSLKAFLIPGIDLTQVLSIEGVQDVRTYFGVDRDNIPHLLVVGVDAEGNDLINSDELVNVQNGWYIYDFTLPCPKTCDVKSPLF